MNNLNELSAWDFPVLQMYVLRCMNKQEKQAHNYFWLHHLVASEKIHNVFVLLSAAEIDITCWDTDPVMEDDD